MSSGQYNFDTVPRNRGFLIGLFEAPENQSEQGNALKYT